MLATLCVWPLLGGGLVSFEGYVPLEISMPVLESMFVQARSGWNATGFRSLHSRFRKLIKARYKC